MACKREGQTPKEAARKSVWYFSTSVTLVCNPWKENKKSHLYLEGPTFFLNWGKYWEYSHARVLEMSWYYLRSDECAVFLWGCSTHRRRVNGDSTRLSASQTRDGVTQIKPSFAKVTENNLGFPYYAKVSLRMFFKNKIKVHPFFCSPHF